MLYAIELWKDSLELHALEKGVSFSLVLGKVSTILSQ